MLLPPAISWPGAPRQGASHGCDSTGCDCRKAAAKPAEISWLWTLAYSYHEDRTPTHGYEPTREAAMAAFAKSWRKGVGHGKNGGRRSSVHRIELILFCAATGSTTRQLEILAHAMQSMAVRGFIEHDHAGAYTLTDSGRATLAAILEDAAITFAPSESRPLPWLTAPNPPPPPASPPRRPGSSSRASRMTGRSGRASLAFRQFEPELAWRKTISPSAHSKCSLSRMPGAA